jgi:O-6-methylguanine DNA methyltransferase
MTLAGFLSLDSIPNPLSQRVYKLPFMAVTVVASDFAIHSIELVANKSPQSERLISKQCGPADFPISSKLLDIIEQRLYSNLDLSNLPTGQVGTQFQHAVWRRICSIPRGTVATYSEVAEAIGYPRAVRAVANACACNTVALAIPCHRVVRSNGSLGGYRWGVTLKQRLLSLERSSYARGDI